MSDTVDLTNDNFEQTVSEGVTLVDFWAEWCGPCKMMVPTLNELAAEYKGKATIAKVNVDNAMKVAQDYGIAAIPSLVLIKDGEEQKRFVGVTAKPDLVKALDEVIGG